jgi:hypothetical protein
MAFPGLPFHATLLAPLNLVICISYLFSTRKRPEGPSVSRILDVLLNNNHMIVVADPFG